MLNICLVYPPSSLTKLKSLSPLYNYYTFLPSRQDYLFIFTVKVYVTVKTKLRAFNFIFITYRKEKFLIPHRGIHLGAVIYCIMRGRTYIYSTKVRQINIVLIEQGDEMSSISSRLGKISYIYYVVVPSFFFLFLVVWKELKCTLENAGIYFHTP